MKPLLTFILSLAMSSAFGQTFEKKSPVTALSALQPIAAGTILGNAGSSPAAPGAVPLVGLGYVGGSLQTTGFYPTASFVYAGAVGQSNNWLYGAGMTLSGTPTIGSCPFIQVNGLCTTSDTMTPATSADYVLFSEIMGAGYSGGRNLLHCSLDIEGIPSGTGQAGMVCGTFTTRVAVNLGGLSDCNTVIGDCNGSVFAINPNLIVQGGTYLNVAVSDNVNISLQSGASSAEKHGIFVSATSNDAVQAYYDDSAIEIGAQDPTVIDTIVATFSINATSITTTSDTGVPVNGMSLSGTGIAAGTTISGVSGSGPYTFNLSLPATASRTGGTVNASNFVGWNYLFNLAPYAHHYAGNVNTTIIGGQGRQAGDVSFSPVAKYGVDFSNWVFTTGGGPFKSTGFLVSPTGTVTNNGQTGVTNASNAVVGVVGEKAFVDCLNGQTSTATITIAAPGVVTWTPPTGFSVSSNVTAWTCPVSFTTTGALPTGLATATTYWIIGSTYSAGSFQLATTAALAMAGTAITTTGSQSGTQTIQVGALYTGAASAAVAGFTVGAGDWDCTGQANYTFTAATGTSGYSAAFTTSSTAIGSQDQYNSVRFAATALANAASVSAPLLPEDFSTSKTYFIVSNIAGMSGGSAVAGGMAYCRRMR